MVPKTFFPLSTASDMLSRKEGEKIRISDNIVVIVVEIRGDKVRLGFDAPREVPVHREEVWKQIQAQEKNK